MADGLRSLSRNLFGMTSSKRTHSNPASPSTPEGHSVDTAGEAGTNPSALHSSGSKRRRETAPPAEDLTDGMNPPAFTEALLAQETRLQAYLDRQFTALGAQLRDLTIRQANHEERICRLERMEEQVHALKQTIEEHADGLTGSGAVSTLKDEFYSLSGELEEKARRMNNIIISGLQEESTHEDQPPSSHGAGEVTTPKGDRVPPILLRKLSINIDDIEECRRLGKPPTPKSTEAPSKPRPLLVRFRTLHQKRAVLNRKGTLRTTDEFKNVYVNDDLTKKERARRSSLVPIYKKLRKARVNCSLRRDKLMNEGNPLSIKEAEVLLSLVSVPARPQSE